MIDSDFFTFEIGIIFHGVTPLPGKSIQQHLVLVRISHQ